MEHLALEGLWLAGSWVVAFVAGGLLWPRVLDWLNGVPGALRTALNSAEKTALKDMESARLKVIADAVSPLVKASPSNPGAPPVAAPPAA